ncbi:MAG: DEAD/DEAH box helicase [Deltaproteobacteria bacterium]
MTLPDPFVGVPADPFVGVPAALRQALEKRGFAQLTAVQTAVLNSIVEGRDENRNLRISSQTGSGKTIALGFALAARVLDPPADAPGPLALIITPTRELAAQVQSELAWLFESARGVQVDVVTGGTDVRSEKVRLRGRARILVGTPGRLLDHLRSRALNVSAVREVVLDEADQMLEMGFRDELDAIVSQLPAERRSHLVSATFPAAVRSLAQSFQSNPLSIEGTALGRANADIEHVAYLIRPRQTYDAVVNLLLENWGERCLIFVRTRADTAELCEALAGDGFGALPFSGELPQAQRTRTLDAFRNGIIRVLVATDVAARGIDVPDIATVIHADLAKDTDVYTHRSGRTGRAGKTGRSLSIVPVSAQARMHRMFREAGVTASWEPVPSPKKIRQGVTKATRRVVYEKLASAEFNEAELLYAKNLLEKQEPERVLALLLRMAEPALPREPIDVPPTEPRAWAPTPTATRSSLPPRSAVRGAAQSGYTRFSISWGSRHGATPARCMSHVCRRGNVTRHAIGAIEIGLDTSSVEVSNEFASEFEQRCRMPDPRDRHVHITLEGAPTRGSAPAPDRNEGAARGLSPRNSFSAPPPGPRVKRAARGQGASRGPVPRGPDSRGPAPRGPGSRGSGSRGPAARGPALADS